MLAVPTNRLRAAIINLHLDGMSPRSIAYELGVSQMIVVHVIREWRDGR